MDWKALEEFGALSEFYYNECPYTGAPDECPIHWPTKLDENGECPKCLDDALFN